MNEHGGGGVHEDALASLLELSCRPSLLTGMNQWGMPEISLHQSLNATHNVQHTHTASNTHSVQHTQRPTHTASNTHSVQHTQLYIYRLCRLSPEHTPVLVICGIRPSHRTHGDIWSLPTQKQDNTLKASCSALIAHGSVAPISNLSPYLLFIIAQA